MSKIFLKDFVKLVWFVFVHLFFFGGFLGFLASDEAARNSPWFYHLLIGWFIGCLMIVVAIKGEIEGHDETRDKDRYRAKETVEDIRCAAIWFNDGASWKHQPNNIDSGYVICGLRHHNCFAVRAALGLGKIAHVQGFLTNKNRFVDRVEGASIAYKAGQVSTEIKELFSEDLY